MSEQEKNPGPGIHGRVYGGRVTPSVAGEAGSGHQAVEQPPVILYQGEEGICSFHVTRGSRICKPIAPGVTKVIKISFLSIHAMAVVIPLRNCYENIVIRKFSTFLGKSLQSFYIYMLETRI